jgi:hypothetical protein
VERLRVAANCDVVAHNFTPKVMRRYGIDYEGVRSVNADVIYVSLTGFGTTGPWGERPLFGPGAESVSGHNLLIGEPEAWPGRPGTIVYADNTCGLNCAFAILAALTSATAPAGASTSTYPSTRRPCRTWGGRRGTCFRRTLPMRAIMRTRTTPYTVSSAPAGDRHVAISAAKSDGGASPPWARAAPWMGRGRLAALDAGTWQRDFRPEGIAAAVVADASGHLASLIAGRGFFGVMRRTLPGIEGEYPHGALPGRRR